MKQTSVYIRLGAMMFLQYAVWGAWSPILYPYLTDGLGMSPDQASWIYMALWLACMLAPLTGGQIADRWIPSQWFLAAVHGAGAVVLYLLAGAKDFSGSMTLMCVYSLLYAPTLAVTNSLAFQHIGDRERQFGVIRSLGTIGWIVVAWGITGVRQLGLYGGNAPDMLYTAAGASVLMALLCLTLPHTPPKREGTNPFAFMQGFRLLKDRHFLVFIVIAMVVTTELQFYYVPTASFLEEQIGIAHAWVPAAMTVAQLVEVFVLAWWLPRALPKLGIRRALALGVIAWPIRYVVFALGNKALMPLVILSMGLHGIGYAFFFVVSQMYVDKVAPVDIRASAQSLLALATLGIGNALGTKFTGWILTQCGKEGPYARVTTDPSTGQMVLGTNWTVVYLVPCLLTVICAVAFLALFRDPRAEPDKANETVAAAA